MICARRTSPAPSVRERAMRASSAASSSPKARTRMVIAMLPHRPAADLNAPNQEKSQTTYRMHHLGSYWVPGWWEEVWVACLQGLYDSRRGRRELATLREDPPIWRYRIWSTSRH